MTDKVSKDGVVAESAEEASKDAKLEVQDAGSSQGDGVVAMENAEFEMIEKPFAAVTGDAESDNTVWDVCEVLLNHQNEGLKTNWIIGDRVQSHIKKHKPKSVSAALEEFAGYVHKASYGQLIDFSSATLRKAHKFREKFSKERLELAVHAGVSYRNALSLCNNDIKDEERDLILHEVSQGSLSQNKIKAKVKELHPPEKKEENRGGPRKKKESPLEFMTRIQKDMDKLLADMKENYRKHAADALDSEDEETKELYTQHYEANAEQVEQLNEQWAKNRKMTQFYFED